VCGCGAYRSPSGAWGALAVPFQPRQVFLVTAPLLPFAVEQRGALAQHQGVRPSDPSCPVIHRKLGSVDAAMHVGPTVLASGHSNLVWAGFPRKPRSSVHKLATTAFRELDRPVVAGARRPGKARLENRRAVGRDGVEAGRAPVRRGSRAQGAMAQPTRSTSQNRPRPPRRADRLRQPVTWPPAAPRPDVPVRRVSARAGSGRTASSPRPMASHSHLQDSRSNNRAAEVPASPASRKARQSGGNEAIHAARVGPSAWR
jgi:hypothetical protein